MLRQDVVSPFSLLQVARYVLEVQGEMNEPILHLETASSDVAGGKKQRRLMLAILLTAIGEFPYKLLTSARPVFPALAGLETRSDDDASFDQTGVAQ
jgi:hypothetical protein